VEDTRTMINTQHTTVVQVYKYELFLMCISILDTTMIITVAQINASLANHLPSMLLGHERLYGAMAAS
jgi:hypothetical protein